MKHLALAVNEQERSGRSTGVLRLWRPARGRYDDLAADGVEIVEEWDEPEYVSVKCRDPDGYVVEASWEP
jgi:hypothetical protein